MSNLSYVLFHPLWFPPIPDNIFGMYGGDDGARTRTSAVTAKRKVVTYRKQASRMAFFWRCKERSGTVIEPISNPRPLPCRPQPSPDSTGDFASTSVAVWQKIMGSLWRLLRSTKTNSAHFFPLTMSSSRGGGRRRPESTQIMRPRTSRAGGIDSLLNECRITISARPCGGSGSITESRRLQPILVRYERGFLSGFSCLHPGKLILRGQSRLIKGLGQHRGRPYLYTALKLTGKI
jgi:hypothetical protein